MKTENNVEKSAKIHLPNVPQFRDIYPVPILSEREQGLYLFLSFPYSNSFSISRVSPGYEWSLLSKSCHLLWTLAFFLILLKHASPVLPCIHTIFSGTWLACPPLFFTILLSMFLRVKFSNQFSSLCVEEVSAIFYWSWA